MIEVGEYVRTKNGEIGIFRGYNANTKSQWKCRIEFQKIKTWKYCSEDYIKSWSDSELGVIEDEDIITIQDKETGDVISVSCSLGYRKDWLEDIRAGKLKLLGIVTKEQFEKVEYKI